MVNNSLEDKLRSFFDKKIPQWQTRYTMPWITNFLKSDYLLTVAERVYARDGGIDNLTLLPIEDSSNFSDLVSASCYLRQRKQVFMLLTMQAVYQCDITEAEFLRKLSEFADECLIFAASFSQQFWQKRYGEFSDLLVIAVGKLGGMELNFSSDVDLILTYLPAAEMQENKENEVDYFIKAAKIFIRLIGDCTEEGIVYRVDLRLRPFGNAGPVILGLPALEAYYQEHGRSWERYALQKARLVNGSVDASRALMSIVTPFVYRRYLDYSVLDTLRELKTIINKETKQEALLNDIKRGIGGIREVEFIAQSLQLIHGGKNLSLRTNGLLETLDKLHLAGLLSQSEAKKLAKAYLFLRQVENRIQMLADKQSHCLPSDDLSLLRISFAMGFSEIRNFCLEIKETRQYIHTIFLSMVGDNDSDYQLGEKSKLQELSLLWGGRLSTAASKAVLEKVGFSTPERALQSLIALSSSRRVERLTQMAKLRLDEFMPLLLNALSQIQNIDETFERVLCLLDKILKRSQYLALLVENPNALTKVIQLFSKSAWIAELVSIKPYLLAKLLQNVFNKANFYEKLRLVPQDARALTEKSEKLALLTEYKYRLMLHIAYLELEEVITSVEASRYLSQLAQVLLNSALEAFRVDFPKLDLDANFLIIAYGRFAGYEMSYQSDIDLIFLYDGDAVFHDTYIKLVKKLIQALSISTYHGKLYEVDPRLRPSGSAGLLVSHIAKFSDYLCHEAWTWEHQALIRSRVVFGEKRLTHRFNNIRKQALLKTRDLMMLKKDILSMRDKIAHEKISHADDLKLARGGSIDIEFLMQYLILANVKQHPSLVLVDGVMSQIDKLYQCKLISDEERSLLRVSYGQYKECEHIVQLGIKKIEDVSEALLKTYDVWKKFFA